MLGRRGWFKRRRTDRRSWPPFQRASPLDVGFRSARNPPGSGLGCRRASVMKESELVSDSGRDAVLVFGGQEVEQSASEDRQCEGAAGGSLLAVLL